MKQKRQKIIISKVISSHMALMYIETPYTTAMGQSVPGSNGNERVIHTPQYWSLGIRCSSVSYLGHLFAEESVLHILSLADRLVLFQ